MRKARKGGRRGQGMSLWGEKRLDNSIGSWLEADGSSKLSNFKRAEKRNHYRVVGRVWGSKDREVPGPGTSSPPHPRRQKGRGRGGGGPEQVQQL